MITFQLKSLLKSLVPRRWRGKMREQLVSMDITHLHGPKNLRLANNEAVVTCVVKNGEFYVEQFIRHYTKMGFRHIFFLDNGSRDRTVAIAKTHKNVSICASTLSPIEAHQAHLKSYLAKKSSQGGWCLDADIDEFFDYPFSEIMELSDFLEYLNRRRYTAVITQLLDMFSDKPLSYLANRQQDQLSSVYQYYDISQVTKEDYDDAELVAKYGAENEPASANAALFWGGIRRTLYGANCLLTKHSFFRPGKGLELFPNVHFVNNARLADVSCLMLHYKLTSNALDMAVQNKEGFRGIGKVYTDLIDLLRSRPGYHIKQNTAVKFRRASDVVESGFLFMSEDYRAYVKSLAKGTVGASSVVTSDVPPNANVAGNPSELLPQVSARSLNELPK